MPDDGEDGQDDEAVTPEGDPVCWLDRVCAQCGRLEDGPRPPACPGCDAPLPR